MRRVHRSPNFEGIRLGRVFASNIRQNMRKLIRPDTAIASRRIDDPADNEHSLQRSLIRSLISREIAREPAGSPLAASCVSPDTVRPAKFDTKDTGHY